MIKIINISRFPYERWMKKYDVPLDVLPELLAVKNGVKLGAAHVTPVNGDFYQKIKNFGKKLNLLVEHSEFRIIQSKNDKCVPFTSKEKTLYDTMYVFITSKESVMKKMINLWNQYPYIFNREKKVNPLKINIECGEILGFPTCCIESYNDIQRLPGPHPARLHVIHSIINTKSKNFLFHLNNFHWDSPFYLISHFPCSYKCRKSFKYGKEVLKIINEENIEYGTNIERFLKLPMLYRDFHSHATFEGKLINKNIIIFKKFYTQCYSDIRSMIHAGYGDLKRFKKHKELVIKLMWNNKIEFLNNCIKIYRGNELVFEIQKDNRFDCLLIRFK